MQLRPAPVGSRPPRIRPRRARSGRFLRAVLPIALTLVAGLVLPGLLPAGPAFADGPAAAGDLPTWGPDDPFIDGTRPGLFQELLKQHRERPFPLTSHTQGAVIDVDSIAVLEDDGTLTFLNGNGQPELDVAAIAKRFYDTHTDEYDFLTMLSDFDVQLLGGAAFAYEANVSNEVEGIGLGIFNFAPSVGSASGRLRSILNMNWLDRYPNDPYQDFLRTNNTLSIMGQESGHRWLSFVFYDNGTGQPQTDLLGRDNAHWSFFMDSDASDMEGNKWLEAAPDSFVTVEATERFSALDQYIMGLLPPEEVPPFFVIDNPHDFLPPTNGSRAWSRSSPPTLPPLFQRARGTKRTVTLEQIIDWNGPRVPSSETAPKSFRMAFIYVIANGEFLNGERLAKVNDFRREWETYFSAATGGRGEMDTHLVSVAGDVVIEHTPVKDTEDSATPTTISALVEIFQRGIPIQLEADSIAVHYQASALPPGAPGGPVPPASPAEFVRVPMISSGAPDQFQALIPAQPSGTYVSYYISASSDSAGIDGVMPAGGAAGPYTFYVGPDVTAPSVRHHPRANESRFAPPVRMQAAASDNGRLGLESLWLEYRISGGELDSVAMQKDFPADTTYDGSFHFPSTPDSGVVVEYRLRARDRAAAPNVKYDPPSGFHTLLMVNDYEDDIESGDAGWSHAVAGVTGVDAWHLSTERNHTEDGGTSWKCGQPGQTYPTYTNAGLVTRQVSVQKDASIRFHHFMDAELDYAENPPAAYDGGIVEVSTDGLMWTQIVPDGGYTQILSSSSDAAFPPGTELWSGTYPGFQEARLSLAAYENQTVQVRFHFASDAGVEQEGWYVDDVVLDTGTETVPVSLLSFSAAYGRGGMALSWRTSDEIDHAGFHVYRADAPAGPWARLNASLLRGSPDFTFHDVSVEEGRVYWYLLGEVSRGGGETRYGPFRAEAIPRPFAFLLRGSRPNPFRPALAAKAAIAFELDRDAPSASLRLFDVGGRLVRSFHEGPLAAGPYEVEWDGRDADGRDVASGVYVAVLREGGRSLNQKIALVR